MFKYLPMLPVAFALFSAAISASERFQFQEMHLGTAVQIILYAPTAEVAEKAAKEAFASFRAIQEIMSDYDSESELSLLCESRGWIRVSDDLFTVLRAAKHYSTISDGAFDVTIGPLSRLWRRSRRQQELPREQLVEQAKQRVGNHLWKIDEKTQSVRLLKEGMRFDLGAIAKGYAIDKAFDIIQRHGIVSQLVDAGGDFRVGAPPPGTEGWRIAKESETKGNEMVFLKDTAMATSGGRFKFVEIDGVRYAHIVDPKTGLGMTGLQTVHVTAPTAMEADALATAVILLGKEKGQALIGTLPDVSMEFVEP
jgi:thiamine biosynthesis lipoprotein